jgi:adenylate kinase
MIKAMILLGAPGSGKGTVAERIKVLTSYVHVSTGDMLRAAVKMGSEIGREAERHMKMGELVPDITIMKLVEERLRAGGADACYMFDGFPRTEVQADMLDRLFAAHGGKVAHVFLLDCPREVLLQRLTGRRVCRKCAATYHVVNIPPRQAGVCDLCAGELYQRPDDSEATIVNRLDVYRNQTEGLVSRYERAGILLKTDSSKDATQLSEKLSRILNN